MAKTVENDEDFEYTVSLGMTISKNFSSFRADVSVRKKKGKGESKEKVIKDVEELAWNRLNDLLGDGNESLDEIAGE